MECASLYRLNVIRLQIAIQFQVKSSVDKCFCVSCLQVLKRRKTSEGTALDSLNLVAR